MGTLIGTGGETNAADRTAYAQGQAVQSKKALATPYLEACSKVWRLNFATMMEIGKDNQKSVVGIVCP